MLEITMGDVDECIVNGSSRTSTTVVENSVQIESSNNNLNPGGNLAADGLVDTSIERLYEDVCDMQSSDQSSSRQSFGSDADEFRIDLELRDLVGGEMSELKIIEEEMDKPEDNSPTDSSLKKGGLSSGEKSVNTEKTLLKKDCQPQLDHGASSKLSLNGEASADKPPSPSTKKNEMNLSKKKQQCSSLGGLKLQFEGQESGLENHNFGPLLLKQARDLFSSGKNMHKALGLALRASKSFELCAQGKPSLELVMSLHVTAAIYFSLGQYNDAIPLLERSVEVPAIEEGQEHALAKFAGLMQLGDTYAMMGKLENSIICYRTGFEIQKQALGETDPRVGETCRYLAEAHVQALQFDEARGICQLALDIHKENNKPASLEEAADRRLMGLICETMGDHEAALEHFVLASAAMVANGQEIEVASVDCSIGDTYLSLSRYDEADFAYQKALTSFKATKVENHPTVGSVFVRLSDLYNKTGKIRESKSLCENALRIFENTIHGTPPEEIASGLIDVSAIYESMNDLDLALKLLQKALKIYSDAPGHQSTIAAIEAQIGVMYYMLGKYSESYSFLKNATSKLRASREKKSAFFGIALNQMGLACVQRYAISEAINLFEEARHILEQEYGPHHPDTLGIYSNLAGTYDAVGRSDDAIEILEFVVGMREEKLGTANSDVDDEKRRLAELLKEAGRVRNRKAKSLENLLDHNSRTSEIDGIKV